jgi:predicted dienelactone hydrolase
MKFSLAAALLAVSGCCVPMSQLVDPHLRVTPTADVTWSPPPAHPVTVTRYDWHDAARNRDVPVTIYAPSDATAPSPVVVFSHGIGEDRDSYAYLGRAWAAAGFVAVHVTHAGTDKATLQRGYLHLYRATKDGENWRNRPRDLTFALDQLARGGAGALRVDLTRVAAAGHSAGAWTALAVAGLPVPIGSFADPRVKTAIEISMPKLGSNAPASWDVPVPVLHLTGTCDTSLIYRTFPRDRRVPFLKSQPGQQLLITLDHARHETFSNPEDALHPLVADLTTAWLAATLQGDAAARAWLAHAPHPGAAVESRDVGRGD